MAGSPTEQPWSNREKTILLAEIIKSRNPPPTYLLNIINNLQINQPDWGDVVLPPGRTLNQCMNAFEELTRGQPPFRSHSGPLTPSPMSAPGPVNLKRPFPYHETTFPPPGREIRPKPSVGTSFTRRSDLDDPPKKKRGRPTRAEAQAKLESQRAAGTSAFVAMTTGPSTVATAAAVPPTAGPSTAPLEPPRPIEPVTQGTEISPMPAEPISQTVELQAPTNPPPRPSFPTPSRVSISSIVTPNITGSTGSSSSSGKRKRGRSTRSDPEEPSATEAAPSEPRSSHYDSPYARPAPAARDSPALAALSRHRNEQELSRRQPPDTEDQKQQETTTTTSAFKRDPDPK